MTDARVITADFADFRQVKSRKVAQLIFEVDLAKLPEAMDRLGWPSPETTLPCAIAPLEIGPNTSGVAVAPSVTSDAPTPTDAGEGSDSRRRFDELPRSQQAGMMCDDAEFQVWLEAEHDDGEPRYEAFDDDHAAHLVRHALQIGSRKELDTMETKAREWDAMLASFRQWQTEQRYGGMVRK